LRRHAERLLEVRGERVPGVEVDVGAEAGTRLGPAWAVVVARGAVEAERLVVVRTDPLGGVEHPALEGEEDLAAGERLHVDAESGVDLAAQPGGAERQAAQVV